MNQTQDKHQLARDLYLQADKTQTEIAEILDVNRKTIYLWCKKGKWEETKIAIRQSPSNILQSIYNHIDEVNKKIENREDRCPTMHEVELLRKLLRMSKDLGKKNTGFYIEAFEELSYFIGFDDRDFKQKLSQYITKFVHGTFGDHNFHTQKRVNQNLSNIRENLKKEEEDESDELVFDGNKFVPVQKAYQVPQGESEGANNTTPTENSELKTSAMGKDGAFGQLPVNPSKPAAADDFSGKKGENQHPTPALKISGNGASPVRPDFNAPLNDSGLRPAGDTSAAHYATLPPERRPAPFREGNIIWINHPKDLDNYEKHLKMSDIIRYYPDMEPGLKRAS